MDPPVFGRGPDGEIWRFENNFPKLAELTSKLLSDNPLFYIITAYKVAISSQTIENVLRDTIKKTGEFSSGELLMEDSFGKKLSSSVFTRWKS